LSRYAPERRAARPRTDEPDMARNTWKVSQRLRRAGTSSVVSGYNTQPTPRMTMASPRAAPATRCSRNFGNTATMKTVSMMKVPVRLNSYMLPHGTRWAARPLSTIDARWTISPATVMATAATSVAFVLQMAWAKNAAMATR
jgi:hypothetical protein